MSTLSPIEKTTRYATTVETLTDAFTFVMEQVDIVGPDPSITITPSWTYSVHDIDREDHEAPRHFSVVVSGMVEEKS